MLEFYQRFSLREKGLFVGFIWFVLLFWGSGNLGRANRTIQGIKLLGPNAGAPLPRTGTSASLQICGVFAFNPICLVLGIITHVLLRSDEVVAYIRSTSPKPKG